MGYDTTQINYKTTSTGKITYLETKENWMLKLVKYHDDQKKSSI